MLAAAWSAWREGCIPAERDGIPCLALRAVCAAAERRASAVRHTGCSGQRTAFTGQCGAYNEIHHYLRVHYEGFQTLVWRLGSSDVNKQVCIRMHAHRGTESLVPAFLWRGGLVVPW